MRVYKAVVILLFIFVSIAFCDTLNVIPKISKNECVAPVQSTYDSIHTNIMLMNERIESVNSKNTWTLSILGVFVTGVIALLIVLGIVNYKASRDEINAISERIRGEFEKEFISKAQDNEKFHREKLDEFRGLISSATNDLDRKKLQILDDISLVEETAKKNVTDFAFANYYRLKFQLFSGYSEFLITQKAYSEAIYFLIDIISDITCSNSLLKFLADQLIDGQLDNLIKCLESSPKMTADTLIKLKELNIQIANIRELKSKRIEEMIKKGT